LFKWVKSPSNQGLAQKTQKLGQNCLIFEASADHY